MFLVNEKKIAYMKVLYQLEYLRFKIHKKGNILGHLVENEYVLTKGSD